MLVSLVPQQYGTGVTEQLKRDESKPVKGNTKGTQSRTALPGDTLIMRCAPPPLTEASSTL